MLTDFRFAFRQLGKSPGFAAIVILTLALGIGANTAIFSIINGVLLKPLDYPEADRLVTVWSSFPDSNIPKTVNSVLNYTDWRAATPSLVDSSLHMAGNANFTRGDESRRLTTLRTTPSFFSTFGVKPHLGRFYTDDETRPGQPAVAVVTYQFWQTNLGGRASVPGEDVQLNGKLYSIVGVLPAWFRPPVRDAEVLVPVVINPEDLTEQRRGWINYTMVGRLRAGATVEDTRRQVAAATEQIKTRHPETRTFWETVRFNTIVNGYLDDLVGGLRPALLVLQGGVLLLLVIACANVANLMLVRGHAREKEFVVRSALGASRWQLASQMLAEGLLLGITGGLAGLFLGWIGLQLIGRLGLDQLPRADGISLDATVIAFSLGLSALTSVIFGLAPLVTVKQDDLAQSIRQNSGKGSTGRKGVLVRNGLVATEIAVSTLLLLGAGLLVKSFVELSKVGPGFDPGGVLTVQIQPNRTAYPDANARRQLNSRLLAEAATLPGVESAALADGVPFADGGFGFRDYGIPNRVLPAGGPPLNMFPHVVSQEYFRALRIPLLRGRYFGPEDAAPTARSVIIDRVLADKYFRDRDPIGQSLVLYTGEKTPYTIIGVVGETRRESLAEKVEKESTYELTDVSPLATPTLVLRTRGQPEALTAPVRALLRRVDPSMAAYDFKTMRQRVDDSLQSRRTPMILLGVFAGVALLLAAVGLYGVLAFSVGQRTREIGIRMALGALPAHILRNVVGQGGRLFALGAAIGLALGLGLSRLLQSLLFGVSPYDPLVFGAVLASLGLITLAACWLPARRASKVDPMVALRAE